MKLLSIYIFLILLRPSDLKAQDTIPRPGVFDEGYFFIGPGDVLKFKSYVQFDGYFPSHSSPGFSEFLIRRARFAATGFFRQQFRYMLYARYDKGKVELNEAFIEARHLSFARLRVGQFKVPFSLSNLKSSSQLDLVSRSFVVENFSPNYDIGVMIFGEDKKKYIDYALGIFNGTGLNKRENNNSKTVIGRLVISPFASSENYIFKQLHIGGSVAIGKQKNDISNTTYKLPTEIPVFAFNDSIRQNGNISVYGLDLEWLVKSFSLKGEYLHYKAAHLARNSILSNFFASGFYVTATFIITGEAKTRNENLIPNRPFDPKKGRWGAFELAGRYEQATLSNTPLLLNLAEGLDHIKAVTGGINWYVNDDIKLVFNYSKHLFNQNIRHDNKYYRNSNTVLIRLQYQF